MTQITDGTYFLHPAGSSWIAARFEGGQLIGQTEASLAGTHEAAGDAWAGVRPSPEDECVSIELAESIIKRVLPDTIDYELVIVEYCHNPVYFPVLID